MCNIDGQLKKKGDSGLNWYTATHSRHENLLRSLALTVCAATLVAFSFRAGAQEERDQGQISPNSEIDEIIVTATKRGAMSVQDVPASIVAFDGQMLDEQGIADVNQLSFYVPSFTVINSGPGEWRLVVRGIQSAGQPQVGLYIDEAAPPPMQGASSNAGHFTPDFELVDIERIEVLRGPQSTAFGVNSQTGVVRVITEKPKLDRFEAKAGATMGSTRFGETNWQVDGVLNLPIQQDKLAVRIAAYSLEESGFIDNVRLDNDDINSNETRGARIRARYVLTDNITWDTMVWLQDRELGGQFRYFPELGFLEQNTYTRENRGDDIQLYNSTLTADLPVGTVTLTGMKYEREFTERWDSTFGNILLGAVPPGEDGPGVPGITPAQSHQFQSLDSTLFEARVNSTNSGPIEWLIGGFWQKRWNDFQSFVPVADPETGEPLNLPPTNITANITPGVDGIPGCSPCAIAREAETEIREKAIFGEVTYDLEDKFGLPLQLQFGLRWFENEINNFGRELFPFPPFSLTAAGEDEPVSAAEDQLIKKVGLTWHFSQDDMAYFTWSQGYRLGGTNQVGIIAIPTQFESDKVDSWEIGLKSRGLGDRLTANVAAFLMDWDNLQTAGRDPTGAFGFTANAGTARVLGIETDLSIRLSDGLTVRGGFTWLPERELTQDQITDEVIAPGREDDLLPYAPDWQSTLSGRYVHALERRWDAFQGFIQIGAAYLGDRTTEFRPDNPSFRQLDGFWLVNGSVGIEDFDGDTSLSIFVRNVLDKSAALTYSTSTFNPPSIVPTRPRTIGVEIRHRFD